jgi:hypothetical protein
MNPSKVARARVKLLTDLPNIGKAGAADLRLLGIYEPHQLIGKSPLELYHTLCEQTEKVHDPCVLDVFISITDFMNGAEPRVWWDFTEKRKQLLTQGENT